MFLRVSILGAALMAFCCADTLTLRSGQVVHGQYVGGDARHFKFAVGDRVETYSIDDLDTVQFGSGQRQNSDADRGAASDPAQPVAQEAVAPPTPTPNPAPAPAPTPPAAQISAGTIVTVRMIDAVDSDRARLGQTFRASVDEPILVDGQTMIARGADAVAKLVVDQESGKFEGRTVLTLELIQVMANGRMVDITTGDVSQASGSRGSKTAKVVGGATALGAIVGALAGGGKGAAIGAGSGAAVGSGVQLATHGERVRIPSETRLNFTLHQPVQL
jgi:hypothetical protein